jgi:hypothetical protein
MDGISPEQVADDNDFHLKAQARPAFMAPIWKKARPRFRHGPGHLQAPPAFPQRQQLPPLFQTLNRPHAASPAQIAACKPSLKQ